MANSEDSALFLKFLARTPATLKLIILFILFYIAYPISMNISANLITPIVQEYLFKVDLSEKEKIKEIKNIKTENPDIETDELRFITGNSVRLRSGPSTKTEILDELSLGQVVKVVSKKRNWIEVEYEYEEGEYLRGWVFTTYTAKFKK